MTDNLAQQLAESANTEALKARLEDSFEQLRADCFVAFDKSDIKDAEGHKNIKLMLKAIDDLEQKLIVSLNDGTVARFRLEKK